MNNAQPRLRLPSQPRQATVELLYRTFGDVLVPVDRIRTTYFRNLNEENFTRALSSGRLQLPITTLDSSAKAPKFIDVRHLAIFIDTRADASDDDLAQINEPEATNHAG
ncbi:pyocin activator PrtN family protein [Pseudomonas sp. KSR10]|uniref:pyocin activator PrtN family protein n=1 Tax=Pseudomonas sp. KSR10 TaxID=2916654 RepID=UPI001EF90E1A|nr:pyocin activator PrtN family protein [Pseudomonas sp. KSR10]MCG6541723.1 pyocin activator PrtN family protein [Pseudomonas sp. KSR10]